MLKLKLQYFGHLIGRGNSFEKVLMLGKTAGRRRGWQRMRWWDGITDSMDMSLSKLREMVKDREAWHGAAHGVAKRETLQSDWTIATWMLGRLSQALVITGPFFRKPGLSCSGSKFSKIEYKREDTQQIQNYILEKEKLRSWTFSPHWVGGMAGHVDQGSLRFCTHVCSPAGPHNQQGPQTHRGWGAVGWGQWAVSYRLGRMVLRAMGLGRKSRARKQVHVMLMVRWDDGWTLERDGDKPRPAETERRTTRRPESGEDGGLCPRGPQTGIRPVGFISRAVAEP